MSKENALKSALDELSGEMTQRQDALDQQRQFTDQANREIEHLRGALVALEGQHAIEKETALREQDSTLKARETQFNERMGSCALISRTAAQARAQSGRLCDELAELEARNAQLDQLRLQLEADRNQSAHRCHELEIHLQGKTDELRAVQANAAERVGQIDDRIRELEYRLTEKQLLVESRAVESAKLKAELSRALEQLAEREAAYDETKTKYITEIESARAAHLEEAARLQEELRAKEQALEQDLSEARQTHGELNHKISELEKVHYAIEAQLKNREQELAAEAETWHVRFDLVETLRQNERVANAENDLARQAQESELATLRHELQQKAWAMAQQQANLENVALAHKNQIQTLERRIDEQRRGIEQRDVELENTRSRAQSVERRIDELEAELRQAEQAARHQTQLLTEEYLMKTDDMNKRLAENAAELQERGATQSQVEQSLRNEIDGLIREAQEKNRILQDRNDELVRVKAETDRLTERVSQIESSASQTEGELTRDAARMRAEFQAQLALLQAELSQKEWALEEQHATANGVTQAHAQEIETLHHHYRQEIEALRQQSARTESRSAEDKDRFVLGEERLNAEQKERLVKYHDAMAAGSNGIDVSFPASENRRWHSRFNWKRRWKT